MMLLNLFLTFYNRRLVGARGTIKSLSTLAVAVRLGV